MVHFTFPRTSGRLCFVKHRLGLILVSCLLFACALAEAQPYTSVYNGVSYSSSRPYNLTLVYFVPNDVPLDPTYKSRLSAIMLWGQNFYKQNMIYNGYGPKTFGLFTETANPNNVKIIVIRGAYPHTAYGYNDRSKMDPEIISYFANNPSQKTSEHMLVLTAVTNEATADAPFYGIGKSCYAIDYPQFNLQYLGTFTYNFTKWFGGLFHELGHGLNLPHTKQTKTEYNNPNQGMTLMSGGNYTLGASPTFINRAGCAILNTCQVFADAPAAYYTGNTTSLTSLHAVYQNGELIVSGTFQSNKPVTDVNIYQTNSQVYPFPGAGSVTWSVAPTGNSFIVHMPVNELDDTNNDYTLAIQLTQKEDGFWGFYPYSYVNGVPVTNFDFGPPTTNATTACVGGSLQLSAGIQGVSYQWQYQNANGSWNNYPEGNVPGYATFAGTHTSTMTVSNVSAPYILSPNTARAVVTQANGSVSYSSSKVWKAEGISAQPKALTTACVGGSLQVSAQASGASYQWQYQNADGSWGNYPEGSVPGYATFSGTKTPSMTVSNISTPYITSPNQARLVVTGTTGCQTVSNTVTWKAEGIAAQPNAMTSTCVGGSLQLAIQASGASYQWQYLYGGSWYNYPEGNNGYATFTGSKTATMTVSNISNLYVTNPNQARLVVTGTNGCVTNSNTVTWKANMCAGARQPVAWETTSENEADNEQMVYPNPVKDELHIRTGDVRDQFEIDVINNAGQLIYHTSTTDTVHKVSFTGKTPGLYYIRVKGSKNMVSKTVKVMKQ